MKMLFKGICVGAGLATLAFGGQAAGAVKFREGRSVLVAAVLKVSNLEKSAAFYKMIGLQEIQTVGVAPNRLTQFNVDQMNRKLEGGIALSETKDPVSGKGSPMRLIYYVRDVKGTCSRLAEAKMPCTRGPEVSAPNGNALLAAVDDPDGYLVEMIEPAH